MEKNLTTGSVPKTMAYFALPYLLVILVGLFSKNKVVVTMGVQYISSYIVDCVFAGIHFSFTGYFCAYGKSYIGFIHNMIAIVCARIPGSYSASVMYPDTLFPMGFAAPARSFISIVICVGAFVCSFSKAATCKKLYKVI